MDDNGNYELETQDIVCLLEQQLNKLPIKAVDIQQKTVSDLVLFKVYSFTAHGWPSSIKSIPDDINHFTEKVLN